MLCPVCGELVVKGACVEHCKCGLLTDIPSGDDGCNWKCLCGHVVTGSRNQFVAEHLYQHVTGPHDWPRLLVRAQLESM